MDVYKNNQCLYFVTWQIEVIYKNWSFVIFCFHLEENLINLLIAGISPVLYLLGK